MMKELIFQTTNNPITLHRDGSLLLLREAGKEREFPVEGCVVSITYKELDIRSGRKHFNSPITTFYHHTAIDWYKFDCINQKYKTGLKRPDFLVKGLNEGMPFLRDGVEMGSDNSILNEPFERLSEVLINKGVDILTEFDVKAVLNSSDIDIKPYKFK